MLEIADYHVAYGQSEVLHGLNVNVAPNEIVAIMGRNGMGKTTLMKALMGIIPARSGTVRMNGAEVGSAEELRARGEGARLRAAGADDLLHHDGAGEHRDRARRVRRLEGAGRHLRAVSRCCSR